MTIFSFTTFCPECGNRSNGIIDALDENDGFNHLKNCLLCSAPKLTIQVGKIVFRQATPGLTEYPLGEKEKHFVNTVFRVRSSEQPVPDTPDACR